MSELQDMLKSEQAAKLMKDSKKLERLRDAPETQRLFQLLSQSAGGDLEQAAGRAAQGDTASLMDAIQRLMRNPEGQKLLQQMKHSIE
jgi:hypothetical protein